MGQLGVQLLRDEPLAKHTTFRIGGPAEWYAAATTLEQLEALAELALEHEMPLTILGGGSNLLVSDAGIRGLVVANQARWQGTGGEFRQRWDHPAVRDVQVVAESGVLLAGLARLGGAAGVGRAGMGGERAGHAWGARSPGMQAHTAATSRRTWHGPQ